jgi:hypothetical protein
MLILGRNEMLNMGNADDIISQRSSIGDELSSLDKNIR